MDRLKILSQGLTDQARANARGKLFEQVTAEVLRHHGYEIDSHRTNVMYAGMEIDIEGRARIAGVPLYAECKCYASDIDCEKLQTFYGKYMTRWFKNGKCHGLFVAIPGINSPAMGFYRENCEGNSQVTVRLLQETEVLDALIKGGLVVGPQIIQQKVARDHGSSGDRILVCSDKGFFWLQYIVPLGSGLATRISIFDSLGHMINDQSTIDYLEDLFPEIAQFELIKEGEEDIQYRDATGQPTDEVVELRGSSACFEYQFPASPEFFVGRKDLLQWIVDYAGEIVHNTTSIRGILFEAHSGWGKSSAVLATLARLRDMGHYALAFDSRSASSSKFLLKVVQNVLDRFGDFDGRLMESPIVSGFDGALQALIKVGNALKRDNKALFLFFDQFENIFYLPDFLTRIAQLILKIADTGTNIILGFSWKTDLVGLTREFPYRWRDIIIDCCKVFRLRQFSEDETNELLDRLAQELHTALRRDLRFLLSEFSQGYPWLLKKLCAHVRKQRQASIAQVEMVRGLLNVEELFLDDIEGLTNEQDESLRSIAKRAPVSVSDLGEDFGPEIIQSLVDRRLIVKVGSKYDIYWDIFRDYLNSGKLPIEEVYLPRAQVGSILKALKILQDSEGEIGTKEFKGLARLSDGAFLNVARDLRLLQVVRIENDIMSLALSVGTCEDDLIRSLRYHLHERFPRNRCVHNVLRVLREKSDISIRELAAILRGEFPYISAVGRTWETYARLLATWLDLSDLAVLDETKSRLSQYKIGSQIRDRSLSSAPRRSGVTIPSIHFFPVVQVATRIVSAAQKNEPVDWSGIQKSTLYKSLSVLEEIKLISRRAKTISVSPNCFAFSLNLDRRREIARDAALKWPVFKEFLSILHERRFLRLSHLVLGQMLSEKCDLNWKPSTAGTNAKIMLDWARHLGLAPGTHAHSYRGRFKSEGLLSETPLFDFAAQRDLKIGENTKPGVDSENRRGDGNK